MLTMVGRLTFGVGKKRLARLRHVTDRQNLIKPMWNIHTLQLSRLAGRGLISAATTLTMVLISQATRAQILPDQSLWANPPSDYFRYIGGTVSGGFVGPSITSNRATYNAFVTAEAVAPTPQPYPPGPDHTAVYAEGREISRYVLVVQGPGKILVHASGDVFGYVTGVGYPANMVTASAGANYGPYYWDAEIDLRSGQVDSANNTSTFVLDLPASVSSIGLSDNTLALVRAAADVNNPSADSFADAKGSWEVRFVSNLVKPTNNIICGQTNCSGLDPNAPCLFIIIHGLDSNPTNAWVTSLRDALTSSGKSVCIWDWQQDANSFVHVVPAAVIVNHAGDQGKLLAKRLKDCNIDPHKVHFIAHSYGAQVANSAAKYWQEKQYGGKINSVTLIDMPQKYDLPIVGYLSHPIEDYVYVPILGFEADNFDHVTSVWADDVGALGLPLRGDNVTNVKINTLNLSGGLLVPVHNKLADYISNPAVINSPVFAGPCSTQSPFSQDVAETSPGSFDAYQSFFPIVPTLSRIFSMPPFNDPSWIAVNTTIDAANNEAVLSEQPNTVLTASLTIPQDADYLRFSYAVPNGGDGDSLSLQFNGEMLFYSEADQTPQGVFLDSSLICMSHLKGIQGELSFLLNSVGQTNAQFIVKDLHFYTVQPVLNASCVGNGLLISWSATAPGFILQSSTNLAAANAWTTTTNEVSYTNGEYSVTVDRSTSQSFFRLIKP